MGRQAASGTSRPKIGGRAIVMVRAYASARAAAARTDPPARRVPYRAPIAAGTIGGVAPAHHGPTLPDMFSRHRTHPERTAGAPARDDRHAVAVLDRTETRSIDAGAVRARLTASTSVGLRDRIGRSALATSR